MTIQEIRDLVAKKISGQGTMVDVGGGLPAILNGILDLIPAALKNIPDAGEVTARPQEITNNEYFKFTSWPIVSYTRSSEQVFGCICCNDNFVSQIVTNLSAGNGYLYIKSFGCDGSEISGYEGILFYYSQGRYFKVAIEL